MTGSSNFIRRSVREGQRFRQRLKRLRLPLPRPLPRPLRVPLGRESFEVHSLVCAANVRMSLWSLTSFIAFSGALPKVVIHDDGTLTAKHRRVFERHFEGVTVLDDRQMSTRMDDELAAWPACRRARRLPGFYCSRKLLDILFVAQSPTVLYIDSDILFFQDPQRLLEHVAAGGACFSADYQDAYSAPRADLERWAGRPLEPCVNAGLLHIPVAAYTDRLDLIERFLRFSEQDLRAGGNVNRDEQTAHALMMSSLAAERLPPAYALHGGLQSNTVSYHFVNDGAQRRHFWDPGVSRIARAIRARTLDLGAGT